MIITNALDEGDFRHYADGRVYWVSPFRWTQELDYSDEWTERRRMQGQYFEETMPPADIEAAQAILDDGQVVQGFVRTTSFDEKTVTKQFVSFAKLLPEFQPLSFYNGAVANLNGEFITNIAPRGNFGGYTAIHYLDYLPTREAGVDGILTDPFPLRPRMYPRYLFFVKINIPVYDAYGELVRTDRIYYPLRKINEDTHDLYRTLYTDYAAQLEHGEQSAILAATLENTQISFNLTSLDGEMSLLNIIKDYCIAIGYSLRLEIKGGGYTFNTQIECSAHELPLAIFADVPFLPTELGESCRLVGNEGKLLTAQHNYVVMGGKKIWGITQNDPLLPQEGTIAETGVAVYGTIGTDGYELIANQSDEDTWANCHNVAHFVWRSRLWPERIYAMLGAWKLVFETHHFNFNLPKSTPFFQYENWLCAISSVAREGTRYRIEAVAFVSHELISGGGDWPQLMFTQGMMTPISYGHEFYNIMPIRGGRFYYVAQLAFNTIGLTDADVEAAVEEEREFAETHGIHCEVLQANLSVAALRYNPAGIPSYYRITDSPLDDRWFEPIDHVLTWSGVRNGSQFSTPFLASAIDGTTTIFLRGEMSTPLNIIAYSSSAPTISVETADGSVVELNDGYVADNLDNHNRYNYAYCRGLRVPSGELAKLVVTPNGSLVQIRFVFEKWWSHV